MKGISSLHGQKFSIMDFHAKQKFSENKDFEFFSSEVERPSEFHDMI